MEIKVMMRNIHENNLISNSENENDSDIENSETN